MSFVLLKVRAVLNGGGVGGEVLVRVRVKMVKTRLSLSSSSPLFFREQLLLRITFLKITAPSPRSSPQGATAQRALRQQLHVLQVPSTRCIGLCLPLFFLSALFQRTTLASNHFPQNNRSLSPFHSPGGYCPAGSSAVTSCPAGDAIDWLL